MKQWNGKKKLILENTKAEQENHSRSEEACLSFLFSFMFFFFTLTPKHTHIHTPVLMNATTISPRKLYHVMVMMMILLLNVMVSELGPISGDQRRLSEAHTCGVAESIHHHQERCGVLSWGRRGPDSRGEFREWKKSLINYFSGYWNERIHEAIVRSQK